MCFNWDANMAPALREVMTRSACRIALTMTAHKMELHDYRLNECKPGKCITLITGNGAVAHSRLWYDVDPLRIYWGNLSHIAHRNEQVWTSSFWGKPAWYLALVKLRRFQDNVARVLFFALYFPVAVLFGLPVRCWFSRGAEWVMMTRRGWGTICAIGVFLSRHAPRLRNILLTCYGKAVSRGYLP
jgi:hypothetical protein